VARIRPAGAADIEAVARLSRLVRGICLPYLPCLHSPAEDLVFFRDHVFRNETVWVGGDTTIEGFCAWRPGSPGWVDHLYVHPDCHGRGLGSSLLSQAMEGQASLRLWVFQRNVQAARFYIARGFCVVERTDGRRNEEREPDMLMEWTRGCQRGGDGGLIP